MIEGRHVKIKNFYNAFLVEGFWEQTRVYFMIFKIKLNNTTHKSSKDDSIVCFYVIDF